jgi:hypothetical protein
MSTGLHSVRLLATGLATVLTSGCTDLPDLPPIIWEGEHLRFGTDADDSTICAGTLPYLDGVVGHLGETFGRADARVDYYWLPDGAASYCPNAAEGCAGEHGVFTRHTIHQHELVHAVRFPRTLHLPFEEGLADAYGDDWERFPIRGDIRDLLEDPTGNGYIPGPGYGLAAHFVSYLQAAHGLDRLIDLDAATSYHDSFSGAEAAFERVYGLSLDEGIRDYEADYPRCATRVFRDKAFDCSRNVVPAPHVVGDELRMTIAMSCDEPTVLGPRLGQRWTTVALDIEVAGSYYIGFHPVESNVLGLVRITRCDISCYEYPDDLPSRTTGYQFGSQLCLEKARYLFRFYVEEDAQDDYRLIVRRTDRPCG